MEGKAFKEENHVFFFLWNPCSHLPQIKKLKYLRYIGTLLFQHGNLNPVGLHEQDQFCNLMDWLHKIWHSSPLPRYLMGCIPRSPSRYLKLQVVPDLAQVYMAKLSLYIGHSKRFTRTDSKREQLYQYPLQKLCACGPLECLVLDSSFLWWCEW